MATVGQMVRNRIRAISSPPDVESEPQTQPEDEQATIPESVGAYFDGTCPAAYDRTRDQSFSFNEEVIIDSALDDEIATVTIRTPVDEITFEVRIEGYTSRFGTLDVEAMTLNAYSLDLYHAKPDSDNYFVRKMFYYGDVEGLGGENEWDDASEPYTPIWTSDQRGATVTTTVENTRLTVYDWRQQMMTHNKPTPSENEIVFQYESSLESGGNRQAIEMVLDSTMELVTGQKITLDFVAVEPPRLAGYGQDDNGAWWRVSVPISSAVHPDDIGFTKVEKPLPSQFEALVWTRDNTASWSVYQHPKNRKQYI